MKVTVIVIKVMTSDVLITVRTAVKTVSISGD